MEFKDIFSFVVLVLVSLPWLFSTPELVNQDKNNKMATASIVLMDIAIVYSLVNIFRTFLQK